MFEPVRFRCLCYFELQGWISKIYLQNFIQIMRSLESNNCNATTNDLKPEKTYQWMLWISMVRIGMVLQKLQQFVMWFAGILIDFYYKELIYRNRRQACFLYLAPGLICGGYWQVNSGRSIFCIADPNYASYTTVASYKHVIRHRNSSWNVADYTSSWFDHWHPV